MAWRLKVFLLLLCLTGICMFCFQQVLVPFTTSFSVGSETGNVHVADDSGIARAKLLIDTVKKREEKARQIRKLPNTGFDKVNSLLSVSGRSGGGYDIHDSKSVESLVLPRSRETTERHVTIAANGSLLYEVELDNAITYSDEKLQTNQDIKTLDLTTTVSPETLDDDHEARIQHLQQQCKRLPNVRADLIGRSNITDFFYSPKYQFAYCKVPKSGSTFWMQLFMVLGRGSKYSRLMSKWTRAQIHERTRRMHVNPLRILKGRLRTIVVSRNPYTRLYSAYIDKVFMPLFWEHFKSIPSVTQLPPFYVNRTVRLLNATQHQTQTALQARLTRLDDPRNRFQVRASDHLLRERYNHFHLPQNSTDVNKSSSGSHFVTKLTKIIPVCANLVTFEEFLQFIISEAKKRKSLEPHWAPITNLCRPCRFNTYKIVKQETFAADVDHSLKSFGIDLSEYDGLKESLTERRAEASIPGIVGVLMTKAAAPEVQKCITPKDIAERIWKSFQIQGFISDDIPLPKANLPDRIPQLRMELIRLALEAAEESGFTRIQQKTQRRKHLVEAYKSVSSDVLQNIQNIYLLDFNLFNYSVIPPHLDE